MKIKKIAPMFTKLLTTAHTFVEETTEAGLVTNVADIKRGLNEYQRVVAVGSAVRDIKVGDMVCVNPARYMVKKYQEDSIKENLLTNQVVRYNFNIVNVNNEDCLLLDSSDIEFVVNDYEE